MDQFLGVCVWLGGGGGLQMVNRQFQTVSFHAGTCFASESPAPQTVPITLLSVMDENGHNA